MHKQNIINVIPIQTFQFLKNTNTGSPDGSFACHINLLATMQETDQ